MSKQLCSTLGKMINATNKFKLYTGKGERYVLNGINVDPMGGKDVKIGNNIYEITPEIQSLLTQTKNIFNKMSDNDIVIFIRILDETNCNPEEDHKSTRRDYIRDKLPSKVRKILIPPIVAITSWESDEYESLESDLEGNGTKTIVVPSDSDEMWTRLKVLLGIKLAGHTDSVIEASQLLHALFKKGEIETEQQYRNAIDKFK